MKIYKIFNKYFLIILYFAFLYTTAIAAINNIDSENKLAQLLNNIHTMQADFQQFASEQKTTGKMLLERPNKFRWEILQPNKQLIIANKNKLTIYDVDLAQITKRNIDYNNPNNPAVLLSSNTEILKKIFKIKIITFKKPENIWFELKPKNKNSSDQKSSFQYIKLHFISGQLKAMRILDNFDQQCEIYFSNIKTDSIISENKFVLITPANTDVLDESN